MPVGRMPGNEAVDTSSSPSYQLAQRSAIGPACTTLHFSVRDVTQVPEWTEVGLCGTDSLPGWDPG